MPLALTAASGQLDVPFHMPVLPASVDHVLLVTQAAFLRGGELTLGDGSALCWSDG